MIKALIKRDTCKFPSITQSENTKTLQKKNRLWYFFQFTSLTAGDVIEISQTKQQVSAPIQPPNTTPLPSLYNVLHSLSVISIMNEGTL